MRIRGIRGAVVFAVLIVLAACGASDQDRANMQKAAAAMTQQRDSTIGVLDSSKGATAQVDTTKLGAAKTESILTRSRKQP